MKKDDIVKILEYQNLNLSIARKKEIIEHYTLERYGGKEGKERLIYENIVANIELTLLREIYKNQCKLSSEINRELTKILYT